MSIYFLTLFGLSPFLEFCLNGLYADHTNHPAFYLPLYVIYIDHLMTIATPRDAPSWEIKEPLPRATFQLLSPFFSWKFYS